MSTTKPWLLSIRVGLLVHGAMAQDLFLSTAEAQAKPGNVTDKDVGAAKLFGGPPRTAFDYKGMALPEMTINGTGPGHVAAIGDWGGLCGTLWAGIVTPNGRPRPITDRWGFKPGPSVFANTRWNAHKTELFCSQRQFQTCFDTKGEPPCEAGCGYVHDVDSQAQLLVAGQLKAYAAASRPAYILNVGDNFYWGGIERDCGTPMGEISSEARHQFDEIFEGVYSGPGLDGVPWLSVLGNHDWGGRRFNNGWDQQVAYTWASDRWKMPAPYYSQRVNYPDQGFTVDLLFLDSNAMDAKDPSVERHNMCTAKYNLGQGNDKRDAGCAHAGGPADVASCKDWFWGFWREQQRWAESRLAASTADWKIIVTHFPCGHELSWYKKLKLAYGLDLLVTGHRHDQELWKPGHGGFHAMGGLYCIVTGGGGGITSESTPVHNNGHWYGEAQYGFYDLVIAKEQIAINSIDYRGRVAASATVPRRWR